MATFTALAKIYYYNIASYVYKCTCVCIARLGKIFVQQKFFSYMLYIVCNNY